MSALSEPPRDPLTKDQERILVDRAADGDNQAVAELYDAYEKRLFGYCKRITANQEDAADATQEAFCNVIQRLPGLDAAQLNFGAYLFTAARNACMDILKLQGRFETSEEVPEDPFAVAPIETDPERALLTADQQRAAQQANERLPEKQRTVLAMREVSELSYEDIASALDMNQNSVAQLISRARLNFHKQLRAGAIVVPPPDAEGQRAIELAAARQDGQIAGEDLAWLNAHLAQNEASRINAEAIQESAVLYRAIGPIVVLAGLRDAALARAADLTRIDPASSQSAGSSSLAGASGGVAASNDEANAEDSSTRGASNRRRVMYATLACVVLLVAMLIATASEDVATPDSAAEQLTPAATGATGEPRSGKQPDAKKQTEAMPAQPAPGLANNTPSTQSESRSQSKSGKKKSSGGSPNADREPAATPPLTTPPAETPPTTPDPTEPTNPNPGGGGGGIPGGPGNICAQPPCSPPPPVP